VHELVTVNTSRSLS